MNFLAHYLLATEFLPMAEPRGYYIVGNALPDLLPLASPPHRFRLTALDHAPTEAPNANALTAGVSVHLRTDAAFHKTIAFHTCQSAVGRLVTDAGFEGIRVRRFFLAHVLTELALDAVLLRRRPELADGFYRAFIATDAVRVTEWAEAVFGTPLPRLPGVLERFALSRYLRHYSDDDGLAEGLSRLSIRARQDAFTGENRRRLVQLTTNAVRLMADHADALLAETAAAITTEK